jgi:hypothetical protein
MRLSEAAWHIEGSSSSSSLSNVNLLRLFQQPLTPHPAAIKPITLSAEQQHSAAAASATKTPAVQLSMRDGLA